MTRPELPHYTTPENSTFHPVFRYALERAIEQKKLQNIIVRGQYPSPTGPIDLVLFNTVTQKVILPIEIKRTQTHVRGAGRRQARDYWQNLGSVCATQFYCVTNLELIELFRYDSRKPKTSAQRVELQIPNVGTLSSPTDDHFYQQLIASLIDVLELIFIEKPHVYVAGLPEFQNNIENAAHNLDQWHRLFVPVCFQYIKGTSTKVQGLNTSSWRAASFYQSTPDRMLTLGRAIDFEHIFKPFSPNPNDPIAFSAAALQEAFTSGQALGSGDDIAELVNEVLADYVPKKLGIVETDAELAQLLAVTARVALGRDLEANEEVLDPASGSGRLLTALPHIAFPRITPKQIRAIEKEPLFAEALSLRLGLAFPQLISTDNAPTVKIAGLEQIDITDFANVKVVVMNPPFISGVQSTDIKPIFARRIQTVKGSPSTLNIGQVALEILFLELIHSLVEDGTVIAMVFPSNHLYRNSNEANAFRKFLTENFGLTHIVTYPRRGLFSKVIKGTVLLVGVKGSRNANIELIEVQNTVNDVNMYTLLHALQTHVPDMGTTYIADGANFKAILNSELINTVKIGWQGVLGTGRAGLFIDQVMANFSSLSTLGPTRGSIGNCGNTALTVFNQSNPKYPTVVELIPSSWLSSLLNTTENMPRILSVETAPQQSFVPPATAYIDQHADNVILRNIIREYQSAHTPTIGVQARAEKTESEIIRNLKSDQKDKDPHCVLIQRGSRVEGEIGVIGNDRVLLSTNVLLVKMQDANYCELMATWLLSVFGQLQLELFGVSQEGMRKLEVGPIKNVKYPNFDSIDPNIVTQLRGLLKTEPALQFSDIKSREIDKIWAQIIAPQHSQTCLTEAFDILQELVDNRIGFG